MSPMRKKTVHKRNIRIKEIKTYFNKITITFGS